MKQPKPMRIDIDAVMNHPRRVQRLRGAFEKVHDGISPLINIWQPYVSATLPRIRRRTATRWWWELTGDSVRSGSLLAGLVLSRADPQRPKTPTYSMLLSSSSYVGIVAAG